MKNSLVIIFIFLSLNLQSEDNISFITGSKSVPLELNLILSDLQSIDQKAKEDLLPIIKKIDFHAQNISADEFFLISKMEIYKALLKTNQDQKNNIKWKPLTTQDLELLKTSAEKTSFSSLKWLFSALLQDAQTILSQALYKEVIQLKNLGTPLTKGELLKLAKKSELVSAWINLIPSNVDISTSKEFIDLISVKYRTAILNILRSLELFTQATLFESKADNSKLYFFSLSTLTPQSTKTKETDNATKNKNIDTILNPVLTTPELPTPAPLSDDWLKEDVPPKSPQDLPRPVNDANWLEDL